MSCPDLRSQTTFQHSWLICGLLWFLTSGPLFSKGAIRQGNTDDSYPLELCICVWLARAIPGTVDVSTCRWPSLTEGCAFSNVSLDALATCFSHDILHSFAGITFCTWDMLPYRIFLSLLAWLKFHLTPQYFCSVSKKLVSNNSHIYFLLCPFRFIWFCLECELLGGHLPGSFLMWAAAVLSVLYRVNPCWHLDSSILGHLGIFLSFPKLIQWIK